MDLCENLSVNVRNLQFQAAKKSVNILHPFYISKVVTLHKYAIHIHSTCMITYHPIYVNNICINRHMWQNEECLPSIPAQMITIITIIIVIITRFFWHPHPIVSNITNNLPRNPQGAPGRRTLPISRFHGSLVQKAAEARPIQRWDRSPMAGLKGKHCRFMGQSNMTRIRYNMHYTSSAQNYMLDQNLHLLRHLLSWNSVTVDIHHINRVFVKRMPCVWRLLWIDPPNHLWGRIYVSLSDENFSYKSPLFKGAGVQPVHWLDFHLEKNYEYKSL